MRNIGNMKKQQICILGATGSIGMQALDVISRHVDRYEVYCLTANTRTKELAAQARKFSPACVVIADASRYDEMKALLDDRPDIKIYAGEDALEQVAAADPVDMVIASMTGFAGLKPVVSAIKAGKKICLANKETLVVAGELICSLSREYHSEILPVDSEHSAIFQSIVGEDPANIEKILLTASGGPFRTFSYERMRNVTAADALRHPTWVMGEKITIDSATMMNKGFEVIEARWLFGVEADRIQVLVHPQSIVHSAVQFRDGAVKAQLGVPDMRIPIQYAMSFPERLSLETPRLDLFKQPLEFYIPDTKNFPCLELAYDALRQGGNVPCIMNAANEVANLAFRQGKCGFLQMADIISGTIGRVSYIAKPTLEDYFLSDKEARKAASALL